MPSSSPHKYIRCADDRIPLSWELQFKALNWVAHALHYLKASNVMLDDNLNACFALDHEKTIQIWRVCTAPWAICPQIASTLARPLRSLIFMVSVQFFFKWHVASAPRLRRVGTDVSLIGFGPSINKNILTVINESLGRSTWPKNRKCLLLGVACCHPITPYRPKMQAISQI